MQSKSNHYDRDKVTCNFRLWIHIVFFIIAKISIRKSEIIITNAKTNDVNGLYYTDKVGGRGSRPVRLMVVNIIWLF